jgi:hypothetical protein
VSSLATERSDGAPGSSPATSGTRARSLGNTADVTVALALGAGFALVAFLTTGGVDIGPNTWTEIALCSVAALLVIALLLFGAPGRPWGTATLLLFAAVVALGFASIGWSVEPENSWQAANQTLAYLAAFGGAIVLVRLAPHRWRGLVYAIALVATVVSGYALLNKVFPATLDPREQLGRLRAPFDYWNATGLMAALGLPPCVWVGARREPGQLARALTVPAISILLAVIVLSYSRGSIAAAAIGIGCWFVVVPLRLRGVLILALGALGATAIAGWALAHRALTHDNVALPARTGAGHTFGLVLLVAVALMALVGWAAALAMERVTVTERVRRGAGIALICLVALLPLVGVAALAASSRGLTGEVSHLWSKLTSSSGAVNNTASRLGQLSSSRPRFWREGLKVGEHAPIAGVGALGYGTARTRYTNDVYKADHAHSYVIETFADFGLIGVAVNLALLVAWVIAVGRVVWPRPPSASEHTPEWIGLVTLLAVVVIFGVHSLVDWTWFIPGTAVPALVCAGWLAGRGPLGHPIGRVAHRRRLAASPGAAAATLAVAAVALIAGWFIWQPLRSVNADAAAIAAASRGQSAMAIADEHTATSIDPFALQPLYDLSAIYDGVGDPAAAQRALAQAVARQPSNPDPWFQLGRYELDRGEPRRAVAALEVAHRLDLGSTQITELLAQARTAT